MIKSYVLWHFNEKKPLRLSHLATISTFLLPFLQAFHALLIFIHLLDINLLVFPSITTFKITIRTQVGENFDESHVEVAIVKIEISGLENLPQKVELSDFYGVKMKYTGKKKDKKRRG